MSNLPELLARVQAATGPDREIDALVHCLDKGLTFQKFMRVNERQARSNMPLGKAYSFRTEKGEKAIWQTNRYSESLDALAALAERVLPGFHFNSGFGYTYDDETEDETPEPVFFSSCFDPDSGVGRIGGKIYDGGKAQVGATEPLARLVAILAALIAKEGT